MHRTVSLGELVSAVPSAMGFTPRETIVALSIDSHGLPRSAFAVARWRLLDPDHGATVAAAIADELEREECELALLVCYTQDEVRDGCEALSTLALEVEFAVPRTEVFAVQGSAWFSPGCHDDDCCPPHGRVLPAQDEELAELLGRARVAATARASHGATAATIAERREAAHRWEQAMLSGGVADAASARALAKTLDDLCVRDWVVLAILGAGREVGSDVLAGVETEAVSLALDAALCGRLRPDRDQLALARSAVERVTRGGRGKRRKAAGHTLAAVIEWWDGNLDQARERSELALACEPGYRLAELVLIATLRGIGPGWLDKSGQSA